MFLLGVFLFFFPLSVDAQNLLSDSMADWGPSDGITSFVKKNSKDVLFIQLNTNVLQESKKRFLEDHDPEKLPKNSPSREQQYSTVGAHEGAWLFASPVDVKEDDEGFIISCDVMSPGISTELMYPQILIRGFQRVSAEEAGKHSSFFEEHYGNGVYYSEQFGAEKKRRASHEGDWLMVYRHSMACRVAEKGKWVHQEFGFVLPKMGQFRPERILLKLYACWPLGLYQFTNVQMRRATAEEVKAVNRRRPSIRKFTKTRLQE